MRHLILLFVLLAGCSTLPEPLPMPKSAPMPAPTKFCGVGETINCQPITPGMREGSSRGHSEEPKETQ